MEVWRWRTRYPLANASRSALTWSLCVRVSTLICLRSTVWSVSENVLTQKYDAGETGHHPLVLRRLSHSLRHPCPWPAVAEERQAEILPVLRTVRQHDCTDVVEGLHRESAGVGRCLEPQRRHPGPPADLCRADAPAARNNQAFPYAPLQIPLCWPGGRPPCHPARKTRLG
jgi:hypothetical protein